MDDYPNATLSDSPLAALRQTNVQTLQLLDSLAAGSSAVGYPDLVKELRSTHRTVARLLDILEKGDPSSDKALTGRIEYLESENRDLTERMISLEHRAEQMMNMFVATYQLYASKDEEEVQGTIAEIAIDLLGAEQFVLIWRESEGEDCRIALRRGLDPAPHDPFAGAVYKGGDPLVDATFEDGVLRLGDGEIGALAVVPMRVQSVIVGVLVLLKLFDHKPALSADDRELLDLLAAHAASALFAANAYSLAARKLHSLESLVRLLQGGT